MNRCFNFFFGIKYWCLNLRSLASTELRRGIYYQEKMWGVEREDATLVVYHHVYLRSSSRHLTCWATVVKMEAGVFSPRELNGYSRRLGFQATKFSSNIGHVPPSKISLFRPRSDYQKLGFLSNSRGSFSNSVSANQPYGVFTVEGDKDNADSVSVNPVYVPTPSNRDLRTPHSG